MFIKYIFLSLAIIILLFINEILESWYDAQRNYYNLTCSYIKKPNIINMSTNSKSFIG